MEKAVGIIAIAIATIGMLILPLGASICSMIIE